MDRPSSRRSSFGSMPSTRLGIAVRSPICDAMIWSIEVPTRISFGSRLTGSSRQHVHPPEVRTGRNGGGLVEQPLDEQHVLAMRQHRQQARADFHVGSLPLAHQWIGSTPFEKKTMPSRSGGVLVFTAVAAWPSTGSDSIQGSARATPMPLRKWRRDVWRRFVSMLIVSPCLSSTRSSLSPGPPEPTGLLRDCGTDGW